MRITKPIRFFGSLMCSLEGLRVAKNHAQELQAKHANKPCPDTFLLHIRALAATQRGEAKSVFPCPLHSA